MPSNYTNTDILIASAFTAFSVNLLFYPLDTIKTRIQSPNYKRLYTNTSTKTINTSLFRGLYQGIGSAVIATVPSSGAFFTTYEGVKSILIHANPTASGGQGLLPIPFIHAVASSTGELMSCFILTPAEVLKQNAQMVKKSSSSSKTAFQGNATLIALKKIKKPSQLWRGYTALAARNLPFTAMQFPMFEQVKKTIHTYRVRHKISRGTLIETGLITAISAGSTGSFAAVVTTPIDVIKTRMMLSAAIDGDDAGKQIAKENQSQGKNAITEIERARKATKEGNPGGMAIGREILKSEGVKGLFRGGALRGLWTAMGSGLYLGLYESGRTWLEDRREEENRGPSLT